MSDDSLFFGPCLNPGGEPAPLSLSDEARARIAGQVAGFLPDGPVAGLDWPGPAYGLTLADVAATMERLAPVARPLRRELHCHADVTEAMKRHAETQAGREVPSGITGVFGIPVIVSDELGPGEWDLRADGKIIDSGKIRTPEQRMQEMYFPPGPIIDARPLSDQEVTALREAFLRKAGGPVKLLTPLPRRVRLRLAAGQAVTDAGIWLCDHRMWWAADLLWWRR